MPLSLIIVVVVRLFCLLVPLHGLRLFAQSRIQSGGYPLPESSSSPGVMTLLFACILTVALWKVAPLLARLVVGKHDVAVQLTGLSLEDLYRFAFVFLGLYFALSSLPPTLTWAHYAFSVASTSSGATGEQQQSLYALFDPAITFAAGLVCMLKGPRWATLLARQEGSTSPLSSGSGDSSTESGASGGSGQPPAAS